MSYEKQGFYAGELLRASQLEAMEEGIIEAQRLAAENSGNNTEVSGSLEKGTGESSTQSTVSTEKKLDVTKDDGTPNNNYKNVDGETVYEADSPNLFDPTTEDFDSTTVLQGKMNPNGGATGKYATALGLGNTAAGRNNFVSGTRNYSSGNENTTLGQGNYTNKSYYSLISGGNNLINGGSYIFTHGSNNALGLNYTSEELTCLNSDLEGNILNFPEYHTSTTNPKFNKPDLVKVSLNFVTEVTEDTPREFIVGIGTTNLPIKLNFGEGAPAKKDELVLKVDYIKTESTNYIRVTSGLKSSSTEPTDAWTAWAHTVDLLTLQPQYHSSNSGSIGYIGSKNIISNVQTSIVGGRSSQIYDINNSLVYGYGNFVKSNSTPKNMSNVILGDYFNARTTEYTSTNADYRYPTPRHLDAIGNNIYSFGSWNTVLGGVSNTVLVGNELTSTASGKVLIGTNNDPNVDVNDYSIIFANGDKGGIPSNILMLPRVDSRASAKLNSDLDMQDNRLIAGQVEAATLKGSNGNITAEAMLSVNGVINAASGINVTGGNISASRSTISAASVTAPNISATSISASSSITTPTIYGVGTGANKPKVSFSGSYIIQSNYHGEEKNETGTVIQQAYSNKIFLSDGVVSISSDTTNKENGNTHGIITLNRDGIKIGTHSKGVTTGVNTTTGLPYANGNYTTIIDKDSITSPEFIGNLEGTASKATVAEYASDDKTRGTIQERLNNLVAEVDTVKNANENVASELNNKANIYKAIKAVQVGDDLSGKTLVFDTTQDPNEFLIKHANSRASICSAGAGTEYDPGSGSYYPVDITYLVGVYETGLLIWDDNTAGGRYAVFPIEIENGVARWTMSELTLPDDFGVVTSINNDQFLSIFVANADCEYNYNEIIKIKDNGVDNATIATYASSDTGKGTIEERLTNLAKPKLYKHDIECVSNNFKIFLKVWSARSAKYDDIQYADFTNGGAIMAMGSYARLLDNYSVIRPALNFIYTASDEGLLLLNDTDLSTEFVSLKNIEFTDTVTELF